MLFQPERYPYICTPITGKTNEEIKAQLQETINLKPDIIEWRADFYEHIGDENKVMMMLEEIHKRKQNIPLLFTIRSPQEGGENIPLTEEETTNLIANISKTDFVDFVDFELHKKKEHVSFIQNLCQQYEKKLILSYHNFSKTPDKEKLLSILTKMEDSGADVAKVAVMPHKKDDVFALLETTKEAKQKLSIPLIAISMGELGAISRIVGWYWGSCLTFAVASKASAPGQIEINKLRAMIEQMKQWIQQ